MFLNGKLNVGGAMDALTKVARLPAHRRISDGLRAQILTGTLLSGSQLPSTSELADQWKTSVFTVHTALRTLVKEGWIDRRNGAGTFIADPAKRFHSVGLYHEANIAGESQSDFTRNLHFALVRIFERMGKATEIFFDSRPREDQGTLLPALAEAIQSRRIQCLIVPNLNAVSAPALSKVTVPTAFSSMNLFSSNRVEYHEAQLLRESMRLLAAKGCRTVGVITHVFPELSPDFYPHLERAVEAAGMTMRKEWLLRPDGIIPDMEALGYEKMKAILKQRQQPDAMMIFPDDVVRGAILAILEAGYQRVTKKMKFAFHRNTRARVLCPFPAIWAISEEETMAQELVETVLRQFDGKAVSPTRIPYSFREF